MAVPLQIAVSLGIYNERIAVSLGFAALAAGIATFASCRSFVSLLERSGRSSLIENRAYRSFYKYHAYYWWSFIIILLVHIMSSFMHTDLIPNAADPDALAHWLILWPAAGSFVFLLVQLTSCRSFAGLVDFFTGKPLLRWRVYYNFYRFHSYYWWLFVAAVVGHITFAAIHTSFWPGWGSV
jgi:hypothetical protein